MHETQENDGNVESDKDKDEEWQNGTKGKVCRVWNKNVQDWGSMKRTIITSNEFVYDVLNNMIHHNEIILKKSDIANSRALKHIVTRLSDTFAIEDNQDHIILRKVKKLDANIKFLRINKKVK